MLEVRDFCFLLKIWVKILVVNMAKKLLDTAKTFAVHLQEEQLRKS